MTTTQLILSIVTTVLGALGGTAGSHVMAKRVSQAGQTFDYIAEIENELYSEIDRIHKGSMNLHKALDARVAQIESALGDKKSTPSKPVSRAKKTTAPVKKAPAKK